MRVRTTVCQICSYVAAGVLQACTLLVKTEVQSVQTSYLAAMRKSPWRGVYGVEVHNPALHNISKVGSGGRAFNCSFILFQVTLQNYRSLPPTVLLLHTFLLVPYNFYSLIPRLPSAHEQLLRVVTFEPPLNFTGVQRSPCGEEPGDEATISIN